MSYLPAAAAPVAVGDDALKPVTDVITSRPVMMATHAAMVYHGYKRTGSVAWALLWGLTGIAGLPFALAQGFGKPKAKK